MPEDLTLDCQNPSPESHEKNELPLSWRVDPVVPFEAWLQMLLYDSERNGAKHKVEMLTVSVLERLYEMGAPAGYHGFLKFLSVE